MKRLLIALLFCLVFSSGAEAGKVVLSSHTLDPKDLDMILGGDDGSGQTVCQYSCVKTTSAFVAPRKKTTLYLKVLTGDTEMTQYSHYLETTKPFYSAAQCPSFEIVGAGTKWTLAWTLENDKGKRGHVIDAVEVLSGTCE